MAFTANPGSFPAPLQPTQTKSLYAGNYIDFTAAGFKQWGQQFLPDVYEKEVERYGNRTIGAFLRMVSAEMPSASDQIIWTEQGRLHTRYVGLIQGATALQQPAASAATAAVATGGNVQHWYVPVAAQTAVTSAGSTTDQTTAVNFRVGQTVMIQKQSSATSAVGAAGTPVVKGVVTAVTVQNFSIKTYGAVPQVVAADRFTVIAYGSEFAKGTSSFIGKLDPSYATFANSPIILKENYSINGSDTAQIGWIEVTSENGANGYLWYMKAEHEVRLRWEDYLEMSMVEGVLKTGGQAGANGIALGYTAGSSSITVAGNNQNAKGTEGFFAALEARGNVYQGFGAQAAAQAGGGALTDFDNVLKQLDKQGAIEENMLFLNRDLSLEIDDILAQQNGAYAGTANHAHGTSFGVFNNSADMALNLGFTGYRRGSYDFYKTDWKYLNDWSTRGGFGDIEGVLIPAGTSTVYDQQLGQNIKRPFLHIRYRSSETENRKNKSWITGSVGTGSPTSDIDEMKINYLSERCLITQAANNFVLFKA